MGFKAYMQSSSASADKMRGAMDGVKGSVQAFFETIRNGDFSNLIDNLVKGYKAAKQFSDAMDEYQRAMQGSQVVTAQASKELNEFEAIFRNTAKPYEARQRAMNNYITKRKELADEELRIERNLAADMASLVRSKSGLQTISDEQIETFATIYYKNAEVVKKMEEFKKGVFGGGLMNTLYGAPKNLISGDYDKLKLPDELKRLKNEIESMLPTGMKFNDAMSSVALNSALTKKQIDNLTNSQIRLHKAEAESSNIEATLARNLGVLEGKYKAINDLPGSIDRVQRELKELQDKYEATGDVVERNILKKQIDQKQALLEGFDIKKKEALTLSQKIAKEEEKLSTLVATNQIKEAQAIALKIVQMKEELAVQEKLAKQFITVAGLQGMGKLKPKDINLPSDFSVINIPKKEKSVQEQLKEYFDKRNKLIEPKELPGGLNDGLLEDLTAEEEKRAEILGIAQGLTMELAMQSGLEEEQLAVVNGLVSAMGSLATGNLLGAAASLISTLIALLPDGTRKFAKEIERVNALLEEQSRLIEKSSRVGGGGESREKELELLRQQRDNAIAASVNAASKGKGKKADSYFQQFLDLNIAIEEAEQSLDDFLRGGVTENTIADAILGGLEASKDGVRDLADFMSDALMNASMNVLNDKLLKMIAASGLMEYLEEAFTNDGVISQDELDKANKIAQDITDQIKPLYDAAASVLDKVEEKPNSLVGSIKRDVSEESVGELAGLLRKISDDNRMNRDYNKGTVDHLVNIEVNTYNTVENLKLAILELKKISTNTGAKFVGEF